VLICAYLVPVVILSAQRYGVPVPQLTYGQVLQELAARETQMVQQGLATAAQIKPHTEAFLNLSPLNYFGLILCLMIGTASLPHVLMRYFTTPSVREARVSVAWSLVFIFILYFTAPAYAAFAKLEVFREVIGQNLSSLPGWVYSYGKVGLVKVCGVDATTLDAIRAACAKAVNYAGDMATFTHQLRFADLRIDNDAIVISTPEIAGLPYVVAGLVAAGGLAAALSTADGLLLAIANALSHDVYYKMIDKNAPTARRLVVARTLLIIVALIAAYVASHRPADIVAMVAWAFSLAAAGLFPALVLGIWWKRTTSAGAVAGMAAGFFITLLYLVVSRYYPSFGVTSLGMTSLLNPVTGAPIVPDMAAALANANADTPAGLASKVGWFNVNNISAALFGLPVGFAVMIIVSLMTPAPSKEMQDFIDEIRRPRGKALMDEKVA